MGVVEWVSTIKKTKLRSKKPRSAQHMLSIFHLSVSPGGEGGDLIVSHFSGKRIEVFHVVSMYLYTFIKVVQNPFELLKSF